MGTALEIITAAVLSTFAAFVIHEAGHFLAVRCFGEKLSFRFAWGKLFGKIPVPRFTWNMPEALTDKQKKIVASAGFVLELSMTPLLVVMGLELYAVVALAHLVLYPMYAGEANDFKWL